MPGFPPSPSASWSEPIDGNPARQRAGLGQLAENRRLARTAVPLEEDYVRMSARPHLPPDAFDDVGPAEEHLPAVDGVADDVRAGASMTASRPAPCGMEATPPSAAAAWRASSSQARVRRSPTSVNASSDPRALRASDSSASAASDSAPILSDSPPTRPAASRATNGVSNQAASGDAAVPASNRASAANASPGAPSSSPIKTSCTGTGGTGIGTLRRARTERCWIVAPRAWPDSQF